MAHADILYDDGVLAIRATRLGLALVGEIDKSTQPALVHALSDLACRFSDIHLDLSGVAYCDVAGLRAMVQLASPDGDESTAGRVVILHAAPSYLRAMLRILGWDALPGIKMIEGVES